MGKFGNVKVSTAGDVNVHPGLIGASAKPFRDALKALLDKHLSPQRLNTMAVMGISPPEPWVFVSMLRLPQARLIPVPGPTLQMFSIVSQTHVVPRPVTNNRNPTTCRHAALQTPPLPLANCKGVSTADFIDAKVPNSRVLEIVNVSADTKKSHFFDMDCVSCQTETAQPMARKVQGFAVSGVNRAVLPKEDWNVRNFGWFPSFLHGGPAAATITRRAVTETTEVVTFINSHLLNN